MAGYGEIGLTIAVGAAVLVALFAYLVIKQRKATYAWVNVALGVAAAVAGIYLMVTSGFGIALIVIGALVACVSMLIPPFMMQVKTARFTNKGGNELAKVSAVKMKGDDIIAKTVMLGSMPETIFVKPSECFKALLLVDDKVIKAMPGFLIQGYKEVSAEVKKAEASAKEKEKAKTSAH